LNRYVHRREANARKLPGVARIAAIRTIVVANRDSVSHFSFGSHAVDLTKVAGAGLRLLTLAPVNRCETESRIAIVPSGSGDLIDGQSHHI
jgi:hypothetical protein